VFDDQGQVYKEYNVAGVPELIFVNREGVVVNNHAGEMAEAQLTAQVEQMMGAQ
jgi:thiol:disulfide interchange protein